MRVTKKTVLMVCHDGSLTGAPLFLERLADELTKKGCRIVIYFSAGGPVLQRMKSVGYEIRESQKRLREVSVVLAPVFRLTHYIQFLFSLLILRPDFVYSNTIVNCGEVVIAKIFGFPIFVHMHEGINFARKMKWRLVTQAFLCNEMIAGSYYAKSVLYSLTGKCGNVIPIGLAEEPITDGVLRLGHNPLRVGILGTVEKNKGQMLALEALKLVIAKGANVELIIAGREADYLYCEALRDYISRNRLERNVLFLGQLDSIDPFFQYIDVLAVCSYDEVFPTVILEAMREMKLVLATRVGGIPEMIEDGTTGLLYEPGNADQLSKLILSTCANQARFSNMIREANHVFKSKYTINVTATRILQRFNLVAG